jgi:hypothetical protein
MASQVHGHMKMAHEQLQNFGISAALSIDQIIADFSLPADSTPLAYKLTSSCMFSSELNLIRCLSLTVRSISPCWHSI